MDAKHDEIFKAMADPHRRQILGELCRQSREAGELARMVGLAPNALSFHLRALKAADLVTVQREGRFLRYSLDPQSVRSWRHQVESLFPAHLVGAESLPARRISSETYDTESLASEFDSGSSTAHDQLPTELL